MEWLIIGLVVGVGGYWLASRLSARKVRVTWYEWLIAIVAVLLALFGIQNWQGSMAELEPRAAWLLLAVSGIGAVALGVVFWWLVGRHNPKHA